MSLPPLDNKFWLLGKVARPSKFPEITISWMGPDVTDFATTAMSDSSFCAHWNIPSLFSLIIKEAKVVDGEDNTNVDSRNKAVSYTHLDVYKRQS